MRSRFSTLLGVGLSTKFCRSTPISHEPHDGIQYKHYTPVPIKSKQRCLEKAKDDYAAPSGHRASEIVVHNEEDIEKVFQFLTVGGEGFELLRLKNRFATPTFTNYADGLVNLRLTLPDGTIIVVEIQVHLSHILEHKGESHKYYGYFRTYFSGSEATTARLLESLSSLGRPQDLDDMSKLVSSAVLSDDVDYLKILDSLFSMAS